MTQRGGSRNTFRHALRIHEGHAGDRGLCCCALRVSGCRIPARGAFDALGARCRVRRVSHRSSTTLPPSELVYTTCWLVLVAIRRGTLRGLGRGEDGGGDEKPRLGEWAFRKPSTSPASPASPASLAARRRTHSTPPPLRAQRVVSQGDRFLWRFPYGCGQGRFLSLSHRVLNALQQLSTSLFRRRSDVEQRTEKRGPGQEGLRFRPRHLQCLLSHWSDPQWARRMRRHRSWVEQSGTEGEAHVPLRDLGTSSELV